MNHHTLKILLLLMLMSSPAFNCRAQSRRVQHTYNQQQLVRVYEYDYVDIQPQFPGGDCEMINFINNERKYPSTAYQNNIQGRVLCRFIVNTDGSISNIEVIRGVEESLNREAVRVISAMPRWKAGRKGDENVPVSYILPIPFRR